MHNINRHVMHDIIYTDFSKAFYKCDHGIISYKIREIGITGKTGKWIFNFPTQRKQSVVINGVSSEECDVKSSVPQGTVLAPLLIIILLWDIDQKAEANLISSFADDRKISK